MEVPPDSGRRLAERRGLQSPGVVRVVSDKEAKNIAPDGDHQRRVSDIVELARTPSKRLSEEPKRLHSLPFRVPKELIGELTLNGVHRRVAEAIAQSL